LLPLLRPATLHSLRWQLLLRPPALGSWRLLLRPATLDCCLLRPPLRLTARGGLQLLPQSIPEPVAQSREGGLRAWSCRRLCQLLFLLLLLIAACTDLGSCTARRGLQLLLLLRPAALPLLLIRSPALHPRLQLLGQLLFLPLLLLMLLLQQFSNLITHRCLRAARRSLRRLPHRG
jgi:hypothetical protein